MNPMPPTAPEPHREDVLRWYTRARKIPRFLGKLPNAQRGLPFGPYTLTQAAGGAVTFLVLDQTDTLWSIWGLPGTFAVKAGVSIAVVFALRLVKPGGRDPLTALLSAVRLVATPRWGSYCGRGVRAARPVRLRSRVGVVPVGPVQAVTRPSAPPPATEAARPRPVTAAARLLSDSRRS